jgi:aspartyl-tRNA(Asn)/glutamyl-tRNA(Gln) amidotransferase subunit A
MNDMNANAAGSSITDARAAPLDRLSLAAYGAGLRDGTWSAAATVRHLLERVATANATLDAFTFIDVQRAIAAADAVDAHIAAGTDLGPLMGVPVALKDLYAADGMPMTAGSRVDVADRLPQEGPIVRGLKRGGAVVLGKTRTTEFAFGTFNPTHPTPRNPCDDAVHRMPGGSSAGSAVAQAAGLCAIAFGTDTGGSVRQPAALCGVAGFKATAARLSMDGVFPLSPTFDSPGWFGHGVADLATVWRALSGDVPARLRPLDTRVLGRPDAHFFDDLDDEVAYAVDVAQQKLSAAGVRIVPVALPSLADLDAAFGAYLSAELVAYLGVDRVTAHRSRMDPVVATRIAPGLTLTAEAFLRLRRRFAQLQQQAHAAMAGVDALLAPACPRVAPPVALHVAPDAAALWSRDALRLTRPGNLFGFCGVSLPVGHLAGTLPVGLQLLARGGDDGELLAIAEAVEAVIGRAQRPAGERGPVEIGMQR